MGDDEDDLIRLWQEKRGEREPQDFSQNLIVQLGKVTEDLNRDWYQRCTGQTIKDVQKRIRHPINKWMAATLAGSSTTPRRRRPSGCLCRPQKDEAAASLDHDVGISACPAIAVHSHPFADAPR